jgi:hypothetical protein
MKPGSQKVATQKTIERFTPITTEMTQKGLDSSVEVIKSSPSEKKTDNEVAPASTESVVTDVSNFGSAKVLTLVCILVVLIITFVASSFWGKGIEEWISKTFNKNMGWQTYIIAAIISTLFLFFILYASNNQNSSIKIK